MSKDHFDLLLDEIRNAITVDYMHSLSSTSGNEPIYPETILAMGLRFCALPSTIPDLADLFGVSTSSARRCINMFLDAIDFNTTCEALQVQLPDASNLGELQELANKWSSKSTAFGLFPNCLGAIDGWLPRTEMPRDVSNQVDYFSGHYHCYGLNVQAMCDPDLVFLYLAVAAPGKVNDIRAFYRCGHILEWLEALPEQYHIVGDNAYPLSLRILIPFSGAEYDDEANRTYNFYLSQMRIRIEMAFGLLTSKWRILRKTMNYSNEKNSQIIRVCTKLHNYCIRMQQLDGDAGVEQFVGDSPPVADLRRYGIDFIGGDESGSIVFDYLSTSSEDDPVVETLVANPNFSSLSPTSTLRDNIVASIRGRALFRPRANIKRNQNKGRV